MSTQLYSCSRQADRQRPTDTQTSRQTDTQTDRQTCMGTCVTAPHDDAYVGHTLSCK